MEIMYYYRSLTSWVFSYYFFFLHTSRDARHTVISRNAGSAVMKENDCIIQSMVCASKTGKK